MGQGTGIGHMAQINPVDDVVKKMDKLGKQERNGLTQDDLPHSAFAEIIFHVWRYLRLSKLYQSKRKPVYNKENGGLYEETRDL